MRTNDDEQGRNDGPEGFFSWFARQERVHFDRLDQYRREEQVLRSYDATRARLRWDDDRRLDAEELGDGLSRRPAAVRARLARTRHGALWLIDRWKALGALLEQGAEWNDARKALAFDLLGVPSSLRLADPWVAAGLPSPKALVDREVSALQASLRTTLDALDDFERKEAAEGRPIRPSPELKRLKREESACWRRLTAIQKIIEQETARYRELVESEARSNRAAMPTPAPSASPPAPRPRPASLSSSRSLLTAHLAPAPTCNRQTRRAALRLQRQASRDQR